VRGPLTTAALVAVALVTTAGRHAPELSAQAASPAPAGACHVSPIVEDLDSATLLFV